MRTAATSTEEKRFKESGQEGVCRQITVVTVVAKERWG